MIALLVVPAGLVRAGHTGPCGEPGSLGVIKIAAGPQTFYVDERGPNQGVWLYEESNLIANLQRGGHSMVPGDVDPCVDDSVNGPDRLLL